MEKFLKIVVTLAAISLHILVRLQRAVEAALWEICPVVVTWARNVIDASHSAVCREQRESIESRREAAPKKKLKPAGRPVSELPSSFPSFEARSAVSDKLYAEWKTAATQRDVQKYGTPEYTAAKATADKLYDTLMAAYAVPVKY